MFQKTTFKISPGNGLGTTPGYGGFTFGCAQEPKDGKIKLVNSYHSCREGLVSGLRDRIIKEAVLQPTDKMHMIFRWAAGIDGRTKKVKPGEIEKVESWIQRSVAALHAFDSLAGWPLTRVYKIETNYDEWLRACYFLSSRRWLKASYMVSLYVLVVRMCKDERITGFKNFDGLVKVIKEATTGGHKLVYDHSYVRDSMPYWEAMMKGYSKMFRKRKMPYYWDKDRINGHEGSGEGIQYLVSGDTAYSEVRSQLLKIKRELDTKKKK